MNNRIRVLIADDQAILRSGLRRLLELKPDIEVVGEAATGREAVRQAKRKKAQVALIDISLPDGGGIASIERLARWGGCRVLILSTNEELSMVTRAVAAGAAGYLSKRVIDDELVAAIRTVHRGGSVFSHWPIPNPAAELIRSYNPTVSDPLTRRERQLLSLLAEGRTTREIVDRLGISPNTVSSHRQSILAKLRLRNVAELTHYAIREELIPINRDSAVSRVSSAGTG